MPLLFSYIYTFNQSWVGMPINHGWIVLGANSVIELGNSSSNTSGSDGKAGLYALGYISNSEMTNEIYDDSWGRVIANAGSEVYEVLQFTDWRGGKVGMKMAITQKDKKVFPITQYYFQNIETPLIMHYESEEYLVIKMDLSLYEPELKGKFVGAKNSFFPMTDGSQLIKYYDKTYDRQRYIVKSTSTKQAHVGFDKLELPILASMSLTSSDFVMPITSNMDIELYNVDIKI